MNIIDFQYNRVMNVSEYYRFILKSHLLIPSFIQPILSSDSYFDQLLKTIDENTEKKIKNYPLSLPAKKAISFKAFIFAMLCVQRNSANPGCIKKLEKLKHECLTSDSDTMHYRYNFSMMYLTLGMVDKCVLELVETVRLFPEFGDAHAALALLYTTNESWDKGILSARKALDKNAEIRPQLVDLCLSSCSFKLGLPIEGAFDYSALEVENVGQEARNDKTLENLFGTLPKVDTAQLDHSRHNKKILFIYADESYYYEHVLALVCSLRDTSTDWVVHLHICNPSLKLEKDLPGFQKLMLPVEIQVSFEHGDISRFGDANMYHSCARFCRLHQLVSRNTNTVVMVDADMLIKRDLNTLTSINENDKVIGLTKTACEPFWATIRGGFCYFKRSEAALLFLSQLSQFIIDNLVEKKGHWFIDQMGLSILYSNLETSSLKTKSSVALLPASECCDSTISDHSTIWAIVNDKVSMGKYNICKNKILKSYGLK